MRTEQLVITLFKADSSVRLGISFSGEDELPTLTAVAPDGAAASAGLEPGDVFMEIDGECYASPLAAASVLRSRRGSIEITVLRTIRNPEEERAATAIASVWRGFEQRAAKLYWDWSATQIQCAWRGTVTRWDIADWLNGYAIVLIQSSWRGYATRRRTAYLLRGAAAEAAEESKPDRKQVNQIRRALSFNRKPRKRGKDGGEFTALLEGEPDDVEARLLARRQHGS